MNILFMCVANSARSQLAEGIAKSVFGTRARVESAGSKPSTVNRFAAQALREIGIDISTHRSKSVEDLPADFVGALDYVITLCAEEVCPVLISKAKKLHWPHPDPAGHNEPEAATLERFRQTRDAIHEKMRAFAAQI